MPNNEEAQIEAMPRGYVSGGGLVPVPDPTKLTTDQLEQRIQALRDLLEARMDGDRAVMAVLKEKIDERHTVVSEMRDNIVALIDEKIDGRISERIVGRIDLLDEKIERNKAVTAECFASIDKQLLQNDKALQAALQAQEKQAIATNSSVEKASTKVEDTFTKQIDAIGAQITNNQKSMDDKLADLVKGVDERFNDVKTRITTIESRTAVQDPSTAIKLAQLDAIVARLSTDTTLTSGKSAGMASLWSLIIGAGMFLFGLAGFVFTLVKYVAK